jgi:sulfatase maturation enzyme AslB (radical SAM superfamily)
MCDPTYSSRLESDYKKLAKQSQLFFDPIKTQNWSSDINLKNKLIDELSDIKNIKYIHFLGGETLYHSAFYDICEALIKTNQAQDIIVGTTTNGTIFNSRLENLISSFKEFHLGISIESVLKLNDYIRYPSKIENILENLENFLNLRNKCSTLQISLRITPNIFTIYELDKLFEYMFQKKVIAESCNILADPQHLRMELLPDDIRQEILHKLNSLVDKYNLNKINIVNVRRNDLIDQVTANLILDYKNFIESYKMPSDVDKHRYNLVEWLQSFERLRKNSILDYAPRYEKFLRNYGY